MLVMRKLNKFESFVSLVNNRAEVQTWRNIELQILKEFLFLDGGVDCENFTISLMHGKPSSRQIL